MILFRIILTVLLFPLEIIFCGLITKIIWLGEEERQAARQKANEERQAARQKAKIDLWLQDHPIESARIKAERERRAALQRERDLAAAEARERRGALQRERDLAAAEAKRIADAAEAAAKKRMIETALATPLPEAQARLLAEMPLDPPRLKDLQRLAKGAQR